VSAATPARANIDLSGVDPVSRWAHSLPATCGFFHPPASYWVGSAMSGDEKQFPSSSTSEWIRRGRHGEQYGVARIRALYDPVHKIAGFLESGTDIGNFSLIAGAGPPPPGVATVTDLAPLTFGGNVHLGDTPARVASEVGRGSTLRPSSAAPSCPGYTAVGFCPWKRTACACPEGNYVQDKLFGVVVFNRGRAVAFGWDYGECGFG
jgi:hypothetical protein